MNSPVSTHQAESTPYSRGLHVAAILAACAVFPLVVVGAGVTSKDAGMAYPDGFSSAGYFVRNPPGWWDTDATRWEHGHRLLGRTVGILAIVVAVWSWRRGRLVRLLGVGSLVAICLQGVLGAFRVYEVSTTLAMLHGIFGQLCFCLASAVALATGPSWRRGMAAYRVPAAGSLRRLCLISSLCVFVQLILGAAYRHFACNGSLLTHVFGAMVVTCLVGWVSMWVMGARPELRLLSYLGSAVAVLMIAQLMLGGFTFTVTVMGGRWSSFVLWAVPTAHVAVGALLFTGIVLITLCTYQLREQVEESQSAAPTRLATS